MKTAIDHAKKEEREYDFVCGRVVAEEGLPTPLCVARFSVLCSCHHSGKYQEGDETSINDGSE